MQTLSRAVPLFLLAIFVGCTPVDLLDLAKKKPPSGSTNPLVGQWLFHGDTLDSSGQGNDIVVTNGSYNGYNGHDGTANHSFNKGSQTLTLGHLPFPGTGSTPSNFTVSVWAATGNSGLITLFTQTGTDTGDMHTNLFFALSGFQVYYGVDSSTNHNYSALHWAIDLASATWYHLAVKRTGSTATLYVNGVPRCSGTVPDYVHSASTDDISQAQVGCIPRGYDFDGYLEDLRVYNRALSDSEMRAVYGQIPYTGLVGEWLFDDSSSNDTSGSGNTGTCLGNFSSSPAKAFSALHITGTDCLALASCPLTAGTGTPTSFTISLWVYPSSSPSPQVLYCQSDGSGSYTNLELSLDSTNHVVYSSGGSTLTSTGTLTTSVWNHVVLVRSGSSETLYLNYIQQDSDNTAANAPGTSSVTMATFGEAYPTYTTGQFTGYLDQIRVYNRALTAAEVNQLYNE